MMANLIWIGTNVLHFMLQGPQPNPGSTTEQFDQQIALETLRHRTGVDNVLALLVPYAVFAMVVAIVWLGMRQKQARLRVRAEFHKQVLEKFGSGREFAEFLQNPASQRFMEGLWTKSADHKDPPLRNGIVLTMVGLALFGLSWTERELFIPGVLVLALGVGYLISSAISYRLSMKLSQTKELGPGSAPNP